MTDIQVSKKVHIRVGKEKKENTRWQMPYVYVLRIDGKALITGNSQQCFKRQGDAVKAAMQDLLKLNPDASNAEDLGYYITEEENPYYEDGSLT